jgi:hypothetical protein
MSEIADKYDCELCDFHARISIHATEKDWEKYLLIIKKHEEKPTHQKLLNKSRS